MPENQTVNRLDVKLDTNSITDEGDGVVYFRDGLTLSDESEQVNGTKYDHSTTDISQYTGEVFADHGGPMGYEISKLVGTTFGVTKENGRISAEGIKFATSSPLGKLAYDLVKSGHLRNVSIGTQGPDADTNGVYKDHSLFELSLVGLGNNRNARMQEIIANRIDHYADKGMDVSPLQKIFKQDLTNKGETMDEKSKAVNQQDEDSTTEEKVAEKTEEKVVEKESESVKEVPAEDAENKLAKMVENAIAPLIKEVETAKQAFNDGAKEPEWNVSVGPVDGKIKANSRADAEKQFKNMDKWEQAGLQYLSYLNAQKGDTDAAKTLSALNEMNLNALKEAGVAQNTLTLGDFGNFVTSPELQAEIVGYRTDYSEVLRAFPYQQTNSRDFSFLTRSGDIDLDDVDGIDDAVGTDNLKPVKEYSGTVATSRLQEMAAVTPISTTANLFMAADLIQDATLGYRTAADKRFAQLPIARLEQAMEQDATRSTSFDSSGSATNAQKVSAIRTAIFSISQGDGVLVMTEASLGVLWDLLTQLGAANSLGSTMIGDNPVRSIWGKNVVTVPNDLMPTLDDSSTYRSIPEVRPLAGGSPVTVTVNHAIFYVPLSTWKGRTNGGLRFDLSADASYESGGSTYSAFQRNEVLLRGAIFRGGAIVDPSRVRGLRAENVIS